MNEAGEKGTRPDTLFESFYEFLTRNRVIWPSLYFRLSKASWKEDCGQASGRPLHGTGEPRPTRGHPSHLRWQIVIFVSCYIVLEFLFVIASGTDL